MSQTPQINESSQISQIFKEITNVQLLAEKSQLQEKKKETQAQKKPNLNSRKNKTMPPSILSKFQNIKEFQKLIYSEVSELVKTLFIINLYRDIKYCLKSLKGPSQSVILKKKIKLKEKQSSKKKFLFLDLDQTLIFTKKQVSNPNSNQITFKLHIRPYVSQFLLNISKHYDVYIFTAATKQYAQAVIKKLNSLNSKKKVIQDFLSREHCFQTQRGRVIKDLRIVSNRSLENVILVDNKVQSFGLQIDNGIPILEFKGSDNDTQLIHLQKFLIKISQLEDVRTGIAKHLNLRALAQLNKEELQEYLKLGKSMGRSQQNFKQHLSS